MLLKDNCSTHNPCGPYGYCEDNFDGQWTCVCKFWWKGTLCDTLSNVGKQVLALGIITGILVILYYSLNFFQWFKNKRRERAKLKITSIIQGIHRRSYRHLNTRMNSSDRIVTWLTLLATLILGTTAVIIKWIILKNIHKEMIDKFIHNQSLFYNRSSICRIIYMREEFNMFTFPLACLLILIFIVTTKRKSSNRADYCNGYFAIPIPLDFFAHVNRTFAAVTFAIVANELSNFANQFINDNASSVNEGVIINYLLQIIRVLAIGFRCYPILAAVYINTRFTLICATLYAWLDFSITIAFNDVCRNDYYSTNDNYNRTRGNGAMFFLEYYGTGSKLVFFQLLPDIPRCFFIAYICAELPILLVRRIRSKNLPERKLTREQINLLHSSLPDSIESKYVENLFGLTEKTVPKNSIARLFRLIYTWRDDFRFSTRVLCVYASIFYLLFFLTIQACVQVPPYIAELTDTHSTLTITSKQISNSTSRQIGDSSVDISLPNFVVPYLFAVFIALIVTTIQLLVSLVSIRRNLLQVFRGNDSEIPRRNSKQNVVYACGNIHFAGYLIGYVLWGYFLIGFFVFIIGLILDIIIAYGMVRLTESILKLSIPPILFASFQFYLNKILGQYVFLQQGGEVLSINHRRILMVYLYFNFFLDALLGFISSIIRVVKSAIGGVIYMCRIDYSSLGRKLETYEAGFNAYCGFMHMECAHRHPVLLYFTSLLIREHLYRTKTTRCSKARLRWDLTIFLLKNPTLIYRRKGCVGQLPTDETRLMLIGRKNMKSMCIEEPPTTGHLQDTTA